jgi:predicted DsbA family dithiol-disulfide isomerase
VGRGEVVKDHQAAREKGVQAIPSLILPATGRALVGLAELGQYRAAIEEAARC